jgi:hypothetical protein
LFELKVIHWRLLNQGVQSDRVNVRVAAEVADYLYRMAAGNLKRFVTYFGLEIRMARSLYITQQ